MRKVWASLWYPSPRSYRWFRGIDERELAMAAVVMFVANALRGEGVYSAHNNNEVEIAALYWHFVDLIWILVFTFVYLI